MARSLSRCRLALASPYLVRVKTQPVNPNQVCVVTRGAGVVDNANITNVAVDCVTPPPSGGLDPGFGGGKVSTAFGGDDSAMALQADGKIVMVGGSGSDFVLARYNADGSLDTSFGAGGLVTTDVGSRLGRRGARRSRSRPTARSSSPATRWSGARRATSSTSTSRSRATTATAASTRASAAAARSRPTSTAKPTARSRSRSRATARSSWRAVATPASGISTDFAVARYDGDGSLDASFGERRQGNDRHRRCHRHRAATSSLQPNGAILVSGVLTLGSSPVLGHTDLARYDANGKLDAASARRQADAAELGSGRGSGACRPTARSCSPAARQSAAASAFAADAPGRRWRHRHWASAAVGWRQRPSAREDDFARAVAGAGRRQDRRRRAKLEPDQPRLRGRALSPPTAHSMRASAPAAS